MGKRRSLILGLLLAWSSVVVALPAGAEVAPEFVGTLKADDAMFWEGGSGSGHFIVNGAEECGGTAPACWEYRFELLEAGARLRVAVDSSTRSDFFSLALIRPDGTRAVHEQTGTFPIWPVGVPQWDLEVYALDPAPGVWTARVVLDDAASEWSFRMRAKLEAELPNLAGPPNLQMLPPHEFGFVAPASPLAGVADDRANPPGATPISCKGDEIAEAIENGEPAPTRCLRFSAGLYEAGDGRLSLALNADTTVTQRIHRANGQIESRSAGNWTLHVPHGHQHYVGLVDYELHRVRIDANGGPVLEQVGEGRKWGWNGIDQRILHWRSFRQERQNQARAESSDCDTGCITLSAGWGDHYRWQRPGQYVPYPENENGEFVVRIIVDGAEQILESNERDNISYAHIRVAGDDVTVCERGVGLSPWDPHKKVTTEPWWEPTTACQ